MDKICRIYRMSVLKNVVQFVNFGFASQNIKSAHVHTLMGVIFSFILHLFFPEKLMAHIDETYTWKNVEPGIVVKVKHFWPVLLNSF